jgi:hypothetical protein
MIGEPILETDVRKLVSCEDIIASLFENAIKDKKEYDIYRVVFIAKKTTEPFYAKIRNEHIDIYPRSLLLSGKKYCRNILEPDCRS